MKEKILVIGASGLIGQELTYQLLRRNYDVMAGVNTGIILPAIPRRQVKIDLLSESNVGEVITSESPDVIINLAAISSIQRCERERELSYNLNVLGVRNLLQSIGFLENKPLLIHFSTDHVFNGFDGTNGQYGEEDFPDPTNFYGETKSESEKIVNQSGICPDSLIIRTSLTFGDYRYQYGNRPDRLHHMIISRLKQGEKFEIDADSIISPTYLEYLCGGVIFLLENKSNGLFHIAGKDALSKYEFARRIAGLLGTEYADRIILREQQESIKNTSLSIRKIADLGFYQMEIEEALNRYKSRSKMFFDG